MLFKHETQLFSDKSSLSVYCQPDSCLSTHLMQNNQTKVNVSISCCHPGYFFNNETGICDHDHTYPVVVRPDVNQHYVYIEVCPINFDITLIRIMCASE